MPPSDRRPSDQRTNRDPIASELGAAQAEIMNVIWETEGATMPEIHAAINEKRKTGAAYTTVLTFVQRLYARDLLTREPEGRTFRYRATKSRDELMASWSDEMIDRLIDDYGQIAIARLDDRLQSLDPERLAKLRAARAKPASGKTRPPVTPPR
jgi:predicted transcriptional regulator